MSDDRGAVAVLVALLVPILFIALAAIVVDVGSIYAERRQQQNGADAGALAVALGCAQGTCDSSTAASGTAGQLVTANAQTGLAPISVTRVCGTAPGLASCPAPTGARWDCTAASGTAKYAQVYTKVGNAAGLLPAGFGRAVLAGTTGYDVRACARAAYGSPSSLTGQLPVTISQCEWQKFTSSGTSYAPAPPYLPSPPNAGYPASYEKIIYFHDTSGATSCPAGPSGADLPGGFGWLQTSTGCNTPTSINNWFKDSTGVPPPNSCTVALMKAMKGTLVYVPIFDNTNGLTGNNGQYYIQRYAAFFLTGYSITGQYTEKSLVTNKLPCIGNQTCISGWFVKTVATTGGGIGGGTNDGGLSVVALTG